MILEEVKGVGFILRVITSREADVVVRLLTKRGDKISALAKAGLKSQKRFGGALEPLTQVFFRANRRSQTDLFFLEETKIKHEFKNLKKDVDLLTRATYLAELTEFSAQEGLEVPEIYNLVGAAWKALDEGYLRETVLNQFEVKLLSILGWLPHFQTCNECGKSGVDMALNVEHGEVLCSQCGEGSHFVSLETQKSLQSMLKTSLLEKTLEDRDTSAVHKITQSLFQVHFGNRKLKSMEFLNSLRRFDK